MNVLVRATPYRCTHKVFNVPYWTHQAYSLELVGHGYTQAPSRKTITAWALDWLACNYDTDPADYTVEVQWVEL